MTSHDISFLRPLRPLVQRPVLRALSRCMAPLGIGALLVLGGCGSTKPFYAGGAEPAQRNAAQSAAMAANAADAEPAVAVDSRATYLKLVEQMQRDKQWFASLAHLEALEQRWGASPEATRLRADAQRQTGQAAASRTSYRTLIGTPLEGAGYHGLGLLAAADGDDAEALKMLAQAQRRAPTDALLLSDLGYAQLRAGHRAEARVPLMQALQLQPDQPKVQANVALYLAASEQPDAAESMMASLQWPDAKRAAIRLAARALPAATATGMTAATATAAATAAATPRAIATLASPSASLSTPTSAFPESTP
jgi:Flp pilus assembly protein TadD